MSGKSKDGSKKFKFISFKDIFFDSPPSPSVILVEGEAGTLKSTLCFSLILDHLNGDDTCGLYLTLEQSWKSHIDNMRSIGLEPPSNLLVSDYNNMRRELADEETQIQIFNSVLQMVEALKKEKGDSFKIFALDSLNAMYSVSDPDFLDVATSSFFRKLKNLDVISLIIFEKSMEDPDITLRERFLADGIIQLGIVTSRNDIIRYLQPIKMAQIEHSLKKRQLVIGPKGMELLGSVYR